MRRSRGYKCACTEIEQNTCIYTHACIRGCARIPRRKNALSRVCVYVTSSYILCSGARLRLSLPLCDYDQVWCARLCCALVCICCASATVVGLSSRMSRMEAQQLMHTSEEDALQASGHLIEARTHARGHNCNQALSPCMHLVPLLISCAREHIL